MAGEHPDEHALLDYVDGERDPAVAEHVSSCPRCAEQIRLLAAGRDALRSAPLLELGEERRRQLLAGLPERPERRSFWPALVAAAALVVVAGLVALATLAGGGGGGGNEEAGAPAAAGGGGGAAEAQRDTVGTATTETRLLQSLGEPVRLVRGPASAVVRLLHEHGIPAALRDGAVVAKADRADVRLALQDRPPGPVAVYTR